MLFYLFWAFAAAWIGLAACFYGLVRRSAALKWQMADPLDAARNQSTWSGDTVFG